MNVAHQAYAKINLDGSVTQTNFPITKNSSNDYGEIIRENVFRCVHFTSKQFRKCELTNTFETEKLKSHTFKGSTALSSHWLYGNIYYNDKYSHLLKDANMLFECQEMIIQDHSLQGKTVKFYRSNGDINEGIIHNDSPLFIDIKKSLLCIHVKFNDNKLYKWIPINEYYSESLQKHIAGIEVLNPDLLSETLEIYIDNNHPEWLSLDRKDWINTFTKYLDKSTLQYKINYKN
jgi:hypothetical protein